MRIGVFADVHDHLDHLRQAVKRFNRERVEAVLFRGGLGSTFSVPPTRTGLGKMFAPRNCCSSTR
jgi:predicted phosphodiesterase